MLEPIPLVHFDGSPIIHEAWPPRIKIPKRTHVGLYEDMQYQGFWHNVMKAFEENRYGKI